jgi:hypothetical protein
LLTHTDSAYVCNDRCVLRVAADGATIRGLPTIVSIRPDGLDAFPVFRDRLLAARRDLRAPIQDNVGLGPHELVDLLSAPQCAAGPVAAFLFPHITMDPAPLTLRRLSRDEAFACFRAGLFRAGHARVLGEVFDSAATRARSHWAAADGAGRWVAQHVPCFQVALGGGGPPAAAASRRLLEDVAAASGSAR